VSEAWYPANSGDVLEIGGRSYVYDAVRDRLLPLIQGAEGDGDDAGGTSTETDDGTSTDDGGGSDGEGGDDDGGETTVSMPQSRLDAIIAREKQRASRGKLDPKELGFDSAKELKDALAEAKALKDELKDADEKALEEAIADVKESLTEEYSTRANSALTRAYFIMEATKHDVAFVEDAFALAPSLEGWQDVEVQDDGTVTGFDDAFFEAMKEAKPFLFKVEDDGQGRPGSANAGTPGSGDTKDRAKELASKYPSLQRTLEWQGKS